jgi:hypothetical protein
MHRIVKFTISFIFLFSIPACNVMEPSVRATFTPQIIEVTETVDITETAVITQTPTLSPTASPTPTPDPIIEQARAFAGPFLAAIVNRPPDIVDDFSTIKKHWKFIDHSKIQDGVLYQTCKYGSTAVANSIKDLVFQVELRVNKSSMTSHQNIFLRWSAPSSGTRNRGIFVALYSATQDWEVIRHWEEQFTPLASGHGNVSPLGEMTKVTIIAKGEQYAVYLNNVPVFYTQDADLNVPGGINLGCNSSSEDMIEWDNLKAWNLAYIPIP